MSIFQKVYDVLVQECQASERDRDHFVHCQNTDKGDGDMKEWRFQGALGFGGKFRKHWEKWYVDCYQEHETPERLKMIEKANTRLEVLFKEFVNG